MSISAGITAASTTEIFVLIATAANTNTTTAKATTAAKGPVIPCAKASDCEEVYLHVQVGNDAALDFYKGFGFEVGDVVKDYYTRLEVNDAHIVSKRPPFVVKKE